MSNSFFESILSESSTKKKTEKQKNIIEVAIKIFAEKGYSNTSTAEIAKAAGVAEGTIFKHYGTKDHLLFSVIIPFIHEFLPSLAQTAFDEALAEKPNTFEQFMKELLLNRVAFIMGNLELFRILVKEIIYKEQLRGEVIPYISQQLPQLFTPIVQQYQQDGELRDVPIEQILKVILPLIAGFFVTQFLLQEQPNVTEKDVQELVQFMLRGIQK